MPALCIDPQEEATELAWQQFAEICGACLGVAFVLILGVMMGRFVTNWGWWRLHGPGLKPHYVKTWHGWVVRDDFKENVAEPEKPQVLRQCWFWEWGLIRADYEWYCWDPHGHGKRREEEMRNRSYLRKLLRWIGIIKQDCQQAPTEDLAEKGESPKKPRHQRPSSGIRWPTSSCTTSADLTQPNAMSTTMISGALDDPHQLSELPFETVSQRNVSTKRPPAWGSHSRASSEHVDPNEAGWAPDENGDHPDTPTLLGRMRKYAIMSTQGLDGTHTRCHSAPNSTPLACNKAPTRAVSDGT
ncbi:hypothetical protein OEA41_008486 [Lepraria neglecta]|uniref:Uncharacterized protein n=1 Tax=Lepraria neglecta TaxID=209136 RepID=A0AAD9ZFW3_9LECA|nr:hypothetical protein OEA41_008486 [Lepraria neglecta]